MRIETKYIQSDALRCGMDLCKEIKKFGHEAYVVGGCVRDLVRWAFGQTDEPEIHDVDIATNMPIEALKNCFRTESNNGEAHGTILVFHIYGYPFEVTQFRKDGAYSDGRHPDTVDFTRDFKEDAARRDFTMNAIGMDGEGNLIDPFDCIHDIDVGIVRAVGDADARFKEDSLRIIRGIRFSVNFGYEIEAETQAAMKANATLLNSLSNERVRKEIAAVKNKDCCFQLFLNKLGKLDALDNHPMFEWIDYHALHVAALRSMDFGKTSVFAMMTLFSHQSDRQAELCLLTREEKKQVKWFKKFWAKRDDETMPWAELIEFVKGDWNTFISILDNRDLPSWANYIPQAIALSKMKINQADISQKLMDEGYEPGPVFGDMVRGEIQKIYQQEVDKM
jgi:tRNA nucleotidyltransferase/poly(A) polymerase